MSGIKAKAWRQTMDSMRQLNAYAKQLGYEKPYCSFGGVKEKIRVGCQEFVGYGFFRTQAKTRAAQLALSALKEEKARKHSRGDPVAALLSRVVASEVPQYHYWRTERWGWKCTVTVGKSQATARAISKNRATVKAANKLLDMLEDVKVDEKTVISLLNDNEETPMAGLLARLDLYSPRITCRKSGPGGWSCVIRVAKRVAREHGTSMAEAKYKAVRKMLDKLDGKYDQNTNIPKGNNVEHVSLLSDEEDKNNNTAKVTNNNNNNEINNQNDNVVSLLSEDEADSHKNSASSQPVNNNNVNDTYNYNRTLNAMSVRNENDHNDNKTNISFLPELASNNNFIPFQNDQEAKDNKNTLLLLRQDDKNFIPLISDQQSQANKATTTLATGDGRGNECKPSIVNPFPPARGSHSFVYQTAMPVILTDNHRAAPKPPATAVVQAMGSTQTKKKKKSKNRKPVERNT